MGRIGLKGPKGKRATGKTRSDNLRKIRRRVAKGLDVETEKGYKKRGSSAHSPTALKADLASLARQERTKLYGDKTAKKTAKKKKMSKRKY